MPDGIDFKFDSAPFHAFIADRSRRMRQAAMYNVRAGGRVVRVAAKAKAPVLRGAGVQRVTAWKRSGRTWSNAPVGGLLRSSITASKRLKYDGVAWSLKVGPRGARVHLYAGKEEDRAHYMAAGLHAVQAEMAAISQVAFEKAWVQH